MVVAAHAAARLARLTSAPAPVRRGSTLTSQWQPQRPCPWGPSTPHAQLSTSARQQICASTVRSAAAPAPPAFPCIDANEARSARLRAVSIQSPSLDKPAVTEQEAEDPDGPEPSYANVVSGYKTYHHPAPMELDYGGELPEFDIAYETWGTLNADKSNAILIHTGLSASSHAASHPDNKAKGWWEDFIGPGKPLDTDRFFVMCTNVIGGCYGSTGPSSPHPLDPEGKPYATRFPIVSIFDMVRAQFLLLDHLGINRLYASLGSSMGGMQSVAAVHLYPERVERLVSISGSARSAPASIALRFAQRSVLMSDPNWKRGFYYGAEPPHTGMKLARQIATITYRSGPEWEQRFGRQRRQIPAPATDGGNTVPSTMTADPALCPDFLIETYLDHQGEQFCLKYDANSLIYISKAMDLFDMGQDALDDLEARRQRRRLRQQEAERADAEGASVLDGSATTTISSLSDTTPGDGSDASTIRRPAAQGDDDGAVSPSPSKTKKGRQHIQTLSSPSAHTYLPALARGLQRLSSHPTLILGAQSDILFPVEQQRELAECLRRNGNTQVRYYELDAPHGHDTFLIDTAGVGGAIKGFLG